MISKSSEGGGSLPIVDYIGFMPIDLGAVNFDALPDISFEVRVPLCLPPCSSQGQALAKARSATSAVDPDGDATVSSHGSAPFRRYPKLAVRGIRGDVRFS